MKSGRNISARLQTKRDDKVHCDQDVTNKIIVITIVKQKFLDTSRSCAIRNEIITSSMFSRVRFFILAFIWGGQDKAINFFLPRMQ